MYEDCVEKFSCNRHPNGCSEECYRPSYDYSDDYCGCCETVYCEETYTECCEENKIFPNIRVMEGKPGKDGEDGSPLEFQWEDTRLKVRVKGTETWYYSPSLRGLEGQQGPQGIPGNTPYIGPNKTWWIGGIDTGISVNSPYTLPKASKQVLGGIRLTDDLEINELGEVSVKNARGSEELGGQKPDYYAKDSEVQFLNKKGVSGFISTAETVFNVTVDMVGKRIEAEVACKQINLPSASSAGKGAVIEIFRQGGNQDFLEVYATDCKIRKNSIDSNKCIQPGRCNRVYISNGTNWVTNFEKTTDSFVDCYINIDPTNGSDTELIFKNNKRSFASFSQIELFGEYHRLRINILSNTTLDKNIVLKNMTLMIWGVNTNECLFTIPADYSILLSDCNLDVHWLCLRIAGPAFKLMGTTTVDLGGYEGLTIQPLDNVDFTVFAFCAGGRSYSYGGSALASIAFDSVRINTNNLTEYTAKGNLITDTIYYRRSSIFIQRGDGPFEKPDTIKWFNNSDTLSRIGTSTIYVPG